MGWTGPSTGPRSFTRSQPLLDPVLVSIEARDVEPVRAAHIEAPAAVEVASRGPSDAVTTVVRLNRSRIIGAKGKGTRFASAKRRSENPLECGRPIRPIARVVRRAPRTVDRAHSCGGRRGGVGAVGIEERILRVVMGGHPRRHPTRDDRHPGRGAERGDRGDQLSRGQCDQNGKGDERAGHPGVEKCLDHRTSHQHKGCDSHAPHDAGVVCTSRDNRATDR